MKALLFIRSNAALNFTQILIFPSPHFWCVLWTGSRARRRKPPRQKLKCSADVKTKEVFSPYLTKSLEIRRKPCHSIRGKSRCSPKISSTQFFVETKCLSADHFRRLLLVAMAQCIWFCCQCAYVSTFLCVSCLRFIQFEWNFKQTQHTHAQSNAYAP